MSNEIFKCEKVLINPKAGIAFYIMSRKLQTPSETFGYNLVIDIFGNEDYLPLIEDMEYILTSDTETAFDNTCEIEEVNAYIMIYEVLEVIKPTSPSIDISNLSNIIEVSIDYPETKKLSGDKPIIKSAFMLI